MMKGSATYVLIIILMLVGVAAVAAGLTIWLTGEPAEEAEEGASPTIHMGDQWVWSYVMDGTSYTMAEEIIGEETVDGRDCYIVDMLFDPAMTWTHDEVTCTTTSMKTWTDKATHFGGVKMEILYDCDGEVYTWVEAYSYDPWTSLFPLEVGKEVEWELTTTQYWNDGQVGDPTVITEKYEVVSTEDITATAGTFSCFKIVMYNGEGSITGNFWYSDTVKTVVKSTDADGNTLMELLSYSVQ